MAIIHGRNLLLLVNGVAVAGARSCELNIDVEKTEKTSSTQWREHLIGRKSWTVTCNHLVSYIEDNVDMVGQTVTLVFTTRDNNDYVSGTATVKSWRCTGTIPNLSQGVFVFNGKGALNASQPVPPTPPTPRLPDTFTELAYLQSDGNQYINTGIVPTAATDVTIDMQITSIGVSIYILGRYKSNGQFFLYVSGNASTPYYQFAWSSTYANYSGSVIDTNRHVIRLYSDGSTSHLNIDGSDVFNRTTVDHSGNTLPLTLFRGGDNTVHGGMPQKIWSAVVKNNGVKVMELVPAKRKADSVVGMYDLVSGSFLTNAGSGNFSYGEL